MCPLLQAESVVGTNGLALRERLLIGLGVAVAAGCVPCTRYHLQKAVEVGVSDEEARETVALAARMRQQATSDMEWRARRYLGETVEPEPDIESPPARELESLTALGVAYAVNSQALLMRAIKAVRAQGISHERISEAVDIARSVKGMATTVVDRQLERGLGIANSDGENTKNQQDIA